MGRSSKVFLRDSRACGRTPRRPRCRLRRRRREPRSRRRRPSLPSRLSRRRAARRARLLPTAGAAEPPAADLSGGIEVDGSSTVGPLVQAAAEFFQEENPGVQVTVGVSGTGGGFERFCAGETDISNASRPIDTEDPAEGPACEAAGIEYVELQVAVDALTVVVTTRRTTGRPVSRSSSSTPCGLPRPRER